MDCRIGEGVRVVFLLLYLKLRKSAKSFVFPTISYSPYYFNKFCATFFDTLIVLIVLMDLVI